jgi:hypothetical protein
LFDEVVMLERPINALQNPDEGLGFVTCENCGKPVPLRKNGRPRVHAFCDREECRRVAARTRVALSRAGKKLRPIKPPMPNHVRTVYGDNSVLIAAVARLYVPDDAVVADVTWGFGVFWKHFKGRRRRFTLIGSDIRADAGPGVMVRADFRQLPYADASVNVVVLDPPYTHCGHYHNNHRYGVALTDHMPHPEIMALYKAGMVEARRVLRPGGTLWVKCKDENDGKQHWVFEEILHIGRDELGFQAKDRFILAPRPAPTRRHQRQRHALKTHSYLWVFRKSRARLRASAD